MLPARPDWMTKNASIREVGPDEDDDFGGDTDDEAA
jgi:hypothetical protein